ncbi:MAG: TIGR00296 family protein [Methanomassiliicoccaceae archaeon]|nr:TIGR00296 family protein [Methanomassiliicoccaceae archaeon]
MTVKMELADGTAAVKAARRYAEAETKKETAEYPLPEGFSENKGVFVTISKYPSGDLRGCIGYPEPVLPLKDALERSAVAACHDPRFNSLMFSETGACIFEVTVLTVPRKIIYKSPEELLSKIVVGRDGLIITYKGRRGLLLPQVPLEFGWDAEKFLRHLSMKAGLDQNTWKDPEAAIESFNGEIFTETSPRGEVVRK